MTSINEHTLFVVSTNEYEIEIPNRAYVELAVSCKVVSVVVLSSGDDRSLCVYAEENDSRTISREFAIIETGDGFSSDDSIGWRFLSSVVLPVSQTKEEVFHVYIRIV